MLVGSPGAQVKVCVWVRACVQRCVYACVSMCMCMCARASLRLGRTSESNSRLPYTSSRCWGWGASVRASLRLCACVCMHAGGSILSMHVCLGWHRGQRKKGPGGKAVGTRRQRPDAGKRKRLARGPHGGAPGGSRSLRMRACFEGGFPSTTSGPRGRAIANTMSGRPGDSRSWSRRSRGR